MRAMTGRGHVLETGFSFGVARRLLDPAGEVDVSWSARATLGATGGDAAEQPAGPPDLAAMLAGPARHGGPPGVGESLLLSVDDAHWADEESLRLFRLTGRSM